MQHHIAIVERHYSFEIQHFFVYVFLGYPELGGDFRLFFKVRFAVTRKHLNLVRSLVLSFSAATVECRRATIMQAPCN